jgi:exoribonuclease R
MSFAIHAAGRIPEAVAQIKAIKQVGTDTSQFDAVRDFVLAELEAWPTAPNSPKGVFVEASGHHDQFTRNLSISIRPLWIREPEPEGDS